MLTPELMLLWGHRAIRIAAILTLALLTLRVSRIVLERVLLAQFAGRTFYFAEQRAKTMTTLLQSILRYLIYFIVAMMLLKEFAIDTTSIVAGAGVFGLALSIGAQNLIRDFVTGFFIILEDQYGVGDYITCGEMSGIVEEIGFRVTKLRDFNGVLHVIPHGSISRVSNSSRGHMLAVVDVPVSYAADAGELLALLQRAAERVKEMPELLEAPSVVGLVDFRSGEVVARIIAKTRPLEKTTVETALRRVIKDELAAKEIPAPRVLHQGV